MANFKKNIVYNIVLHLSNILFPIITTPYIARVLGVEIVGIVNFTWAYAGYFALFAMLGIPMYGAREIAAHRDNYQKRSRIFSELLIITAISGTIVSIIYMATLYTIPQLYQQREFLIPVGIPLILSFLSTEWFFTGRERFGMITVRSIIIKSLGIAALFLLVKSREDTIIYIWILIISSLATNGWNMWYLLRYEVKLTLQGLNFRPHLKPVMTLFISSIAISVYSMLDTLMLGFLSNYREVGFYTSASKICRIFIPISVSAGVVLMPSLSHLFKTGERSQINETLSRGFAFVSFFALPVTAGLMLISSGFVPLFFGDEFAGAIPSMQILSILVLLIGVNHTYSTQTLVASGHNREFMISAIAGMLINFALNMALIPSFGSLGASYASVAAEVAVLAIVIYYSWRAVKIKVNITPLIKAAASSLPFIIALIILPESKSWRELAIYISASAVSYLAIQHLLFKNQITKQALDRVTSILKIR